MRQGKLGGRQVVRSGIAAALGELAQGLGFKRSDQELAKALNGKMSVLCNCWGMNPEDIAEARRIILANLKAQIKQMEPRAARQGLSIEQRKRQFDNALFVSFNIVEDIPGVTDCNLMERQSSLELADRNGGYWIGIKSCQRDFTYAIREIERKILSAGYARINPQPGSGDGALAPAPMEVGSPASLSRNDVPEESSPSDPTDPPAPRRFLRTKVVVPSLAAGVLLVGGLVFAINLVGHSPDPKPSPSVSAPPVLASFAQLAPAVPDYNNVWVLPGVKPASDAAMFSNKGLTSASWAPGMNGTLVNDANYRITLTGEAADGLTITNITADVVKRSAPLTGTLIDIGSQGMNSNQQFLFKLGQSPAEALYGDPTNQAYDQPVFSGNNVTLAKAESMTINVEATATGADYKFDLQATVVIDGKEQTVTILGPSNKPFEVTGLAESYPSVFTHSPDFTKIISVGAVSDCPKQCP